MGETRLRPATVAGSGYCAGAAFDSPAPAGAAPGGGTPSPPVGAGRLLFSAASWSSLPATPPIAEPPAAGPLDGASPRTASPGAVPGVAGDGVTDDGEGVVGDGATDDGEGVFGDGVGAATGASAGGAVTGAGLRSQPAAPSSVAAMTPIPRVGQCFMPRRHARRVPAGAARCGQPGHEVKSLPMNADSPSTDPCRGSQANEGAEGMPDLRCADHVATITLRRPSRRNRLSDDDLRTLLRHFAAVDSDPSIRVVILAARTEGQPRPVFSAGYDLGAFDGGGDGPGLFEQIPDALERLRPVTICALGGSVHGGSTDLVLACDFRIALAGGEWRMPACALGLHYYPSGLRRYVERMGLDGARRVFLRAEAMPFEALQAYGLFDALLPADEIDAAVAALAARIASLAPIAVQGTKQSLLDIASGRADIGTLRAREQAAADSDDFTEGRRAFAERRIPRFSGR